MKNRPMLWLCRCPALCCFSTPLQWNGLDRVKKKKNKYYNGSFLALFTKSHWVIVSNCHVIFLMWFRLTHSCTSCFRKLFGRIRRRHKRLDGKRSHVLKNRSHMLRCSMKVETKHITISTRLLKKWCVVSKLFFLYEATCLPDIFPYEEFHHLE